MCLRDKFKLYTAFSIIILFKNFTVFLEINLLKIYEDLCPDGTMTFLAFGNNLKSPFDACEGITLSNTPWNIKTG